MKGEIHKGNWCSYRISVDVLRLSCLMHVVGVVVLDVRGGAGRFSFNGRTMPQVAS